MDFPGERMAPSPGLAIMRPTPAFIPVTLFLLAACDQADAPVAEEPAPTVSSSPATAQPRSTGVPAARPTRAPDLTPLPLVPNAERGVKGARNVLLSWARAIELREFGQAYALMSESDRRKWSEAEFAAMFNDLDPITVAVPGGTMEGAAGSLFYTSQATITATDGDGRPVRIEGPVVLRRVNDVPGATSSQLLWHIESADLAVTH